MDICAVGVAWRLLLLLGMRIGKLCLAAFLGAMPAVAVAQPAVGVGVNVSVGDDAYDTVAPGDPVESVDVFYDQLEPYGAWVDEPEVGRVFVPETADYVPYTTGHWQYTSLGFVWVSSEPHAWATAHYGRWAYSSNYGRWYWKPDTEWGPAWVEWRQTGNDFGWAPLPPEVVVRRGWQPPVESWHYCGAAHVLDVDVHRYYEPRTRVVEIHREARPIEHYTTVSNVRVVVGPPAAALRERHVVARPVKVEARAVGRWSPAEAHAQVARAREHQATFEVQNQRRIESDAKLRAAHVKVIDTHPDIKVKVNARVQAAAHPAAPARVEPGRPGAPDRAEPVRVEPKEPARVEPKPPAPTRERETPKPNERVAPKPPEHVAPKPPEHVAPKPPEHVAPKPPEQRAQPAPRPPEQRAQPAPRPPEQHAQPAPRPPEQRAQPAPREPQAPRIDQHPAPTRERAEPAPRAPVEHAPSRPAPAKPAEHDRKEPDHR